MKIVQYNISNFEKYLFYFSLVSIFLLPSINLFPNLFAIRPEDIIFPIIVCIVICNKAYIDFFYSRFLLLFSAYILFTILINNMHAYRDYSEIYKIIKYLFYLMFFMYSIKKFTYLKILEVIFVFVFIFNIMHYFNVFNFNNIIEPFYTSELRILFFGKNSLGFPDTKRMLGTMGNPNNNAIMFLFFITLFIPGKKSNKIHNIIFYLAFSGVLFTQSRTGMVAFIVIVIVNIFIQKLRYKIVLKQLGFFALIFLTINLLEYIELSLVKPLSPDEKKELIEKGEKLDRDRLFHASKYLTNIIEDDMSETFFSGRFNTWNMLWAMIKEKPVFGHGPWKNYFYKNNIYPESEYVLMTWRYGFLGLLFYLACILLPFIWYFKRIDIKRSNYYVLFLLIVLITALMNNPMSEPRILLLIAFMNAIFFNQYLNKTIDEKTFVNR